MNMPFFYCPALRGRGEKENAKTHKKTRVLNLFSQHSMLLVQTERQLGVALHVRIRVRNVNEDRMYSGPKHLLKNFTELRYIEICGRSPLVRQFVQLRTVIASRSKTPLRWFWVIKIQL